MLVLLAALATQIGPGDPPPSPTPQETLALELVNRMRADPEGEAARLLADRPRPAYQGFDAQMFTDELSSMPAAQPLVFHPRLIAAGRNHSRYTERNREFGHGETEGRPGFTGESGFVRARFAGYPEARGVAFENAGSFVVGGVYGCHWGCAVDDGPGGPGGMQARRGHRKTMMDRRWREYGTGFVFHADGRAENSALFGDGPDHRLVGGVAFLDLDADGFYDPGEGVGGVQITLGDASRCASWTSGAYTLDPGSVRAAAKTRWTATLYDVTVTADLPRGTTNVKADAELLAPVLARWKQLQAALDRRPSAARERAVHDLAFWTAALPGAAEGRDFGEEVAATRSAWVEHSAWWLGRLAPDAPDTGEDSPPAPPVPDAPAYEAPAYEAPAYEAPRGTLAAAWMQQAMHLRSLATALAEAEASSASKATRARRRQKLLRELGALRTDITMPRLLGPLDALAARIERLE